MTLPDLEQFLVALAARPLSVEEIDRIECACVDIMRDPDCHTKLDQARASMMLRMIYEIRRARGFSSDVIANGVN